MSLKAPISVCYINKDDSHITKSVESVLPFVEEVIVVDTGSRNEPALPDGVKFARFLDCNDSQGRIADFSLAREFSFSLATQPYISWGDSDDLVDNAVKLVDVVRNAEKVAAGRNVRVFAPYEYAYDFDEQCCLLQGRERVVNRGAWKWARPIHEGLVPVDTKAPSVDVVDIQVVWKHQRQKSASVEVNTRDAGRNVRILEAAVRRGEDDARLHLDLGVEYATAAQVTAGDEVRRAEIHTGARRHLNMSLDRSPSTVDEFSAHLELAEVAFRDAACKTYFDGRPFDPKESEEHLFAALRLMDHWETAYFRIARLAYATSSSGILTDVQRRKYEDRCIRYARLGLEAKAPPLPYSHNPLDRKVAVHEWLHDCLARTGDLDGALAEVEIALQTKPMLKHLRAAKREYESSICRKRVISDIQLLHKFGAVDDALSEIATSAIDDPVGLKDRLGKMARGTEKENVLPTLAELYATLNGEGPLNIVFACGTTLEPWNPDIYAERGVGGSETAVIEMAKRLAGRGHKVRVYCSCGEEMEREGVQYLRSGKLFASPACDILVVWRMAQLLDQENGPVSARARVLWVHDVDPAFMSIARGFLADRVLGLSKWHCDHLAKEYNLHPDQIVQSRNGIDLSKFEQDIPREFPHRAVWSSSFDRGLTNLLSYWPDIRKQVPDAELHIFYGNEAHKKAATHLKDPVMQKWIDEVEERIASLADQGVVYRGRVEQRQLAKEFMKAGAWLQSTSFSETSCLTAMEAQLAGLAVVASDLAALHETVKHGVLIPGTPDDEQCENGQSYRDAFIKAAVYALQTPEEERLNIIEDAKKSFSWDPVADQWEDIFRDVLQSVESGELLSYVPQADAAE